jgi:hypothetical protein
MFLRSPIIIGAMAVILGTSAYAQQAQPVSVRVRGTIEKVSSTALQVHTREGTSTQLTLTDKTTYAGVKRLQLTDIRPNSYIGVSGRPLAGGNIEALELHVFPEAARGTGEGHREWDLVPNSSMTNATVTAVVVSASGRDLEVRYQGKTVKIKVPGTTPIVTYVPAVARDAAPGLAVVVSASKDGSGKLTAHRVILEQDGVKPPM